MEDIELEDPKAAFLRTALRADRDRERRNEGEYPEAIADMDDVLIGIVEDLACYGGQPFVRDRIYDRIGAMYSCDLATPHTHVDGLPGGGPYREQCAAR